MKRPLLTAVLAAMCAAGFIATSEAAEKERPDFGKREYDAKCAVCHGKTGTGNGPYAGIINTRIPDITVLAKNNGGVFPLDRVQASIDGRQMPKAHGTRDMPIWGTVYTAGMRDVLIDVPYDAELYVRTRVVALSDYVYRLQAK